MLAGAIGARCRLFQTSVFRDYSSIAFKTLFHLVRSLNYFFATRTTLLQISFAEAFDFRCARASVYIFIRVSSPRCSPSSGGHICVPPRPPQHGGEDTGLGRLWGPPPPAPLSRSHPPPPTLFAFPPLLAAEICFGGGGGSSPRHK